MLGFGSLAWHLPSPHLSQQPLSPLSILANAAEELRAIVPLRLREHNTTNSGAAVRARAGLVKAWCHLAVGGSAVA